MARKASVESPMDITEDKRKNEVELTAIKRAMRNTRWWKVFITVFMIAGIVAPVIRAGRGSEQRARLPASSHRNIQKREHQLACGVRQERAIRTKGTIQ